MTGPLLNVDLGSMREREPGSTEGQRIPAQRTPDVENAAGFGPRTDVLVIDPEQITREALRRALTDIGIGSITTAGSVADVEALLTDGLTGDLVLISMMLGREAPEAIGMLRAAGWKRALSISPVAEIGPVIDAVSAGVTGVIVGRRAHTASGNVPRAIHDLSSREIEVIKLVADGRSNKWIGAALELSALTVKSHLARIGRKLGTGDRAHMVALAMRAGVIS